MDHGFLIGGVSEFKSCSDLSTAMCCKYPCLQRAMGLCTSVLDWGEKRDRHAE